jgi:hypothetical protein
MGYHYQIKDSIMQQQVTGQPNLFLFVPFVTRIQLHTSKLTLKACTHRNLD